jgi:hypothetical protein
MEVGTDEHAGLKIRPRRVAAAVVRGRYLSHPRADMNRAVVIKQVFSVRGSDDGGGVGGGAKPQVGVRSEDVVGPGKEMLGAAVEIVP